VIPLPRKERPVRRARNRRGNPWGVRVEPGKARPLPWRLVDGPFGCRVVVQGAVVVRVETHDAVPLSSIPFFLGLPFHGRRIGMLHLQPIRRAPRTIGRVRFRPATKAPVAFHPTFVGHCFKMTKNLAPFLESMKAAAIASFGPSERQQIPFRMTIISDMIQNTAPHPAIQ
jgi:hypothetical protein